MSEEEENEIQTMQRLLMGEIRNLKHPDKVKRHFMLYFGIPQESPEKLQLDQLMFKFDDQNAKTVKLIEEVRAEAKRETKFLKYAIIALAVGSGVLGLVSEEVLMSLFRILGFG